MKTLPQYWPNQLFKFLSGIVLYGLCLSSYSQNEPLYVPKNTSYPGIIQTFEKLAQIDLEKNQKKINLLIKEGRTISNFKSVKDFGLDDDFINSIILHSNSGYLKLSSENKCRFFEGILTNLLKNSEGKIENIILTYPENEKRLTFLMNKKEFLARVVPQDCPETQKNISAFQLKTLENTLNGLDFSIPKSVAECKNIYEKWINHPQTIFLCQIHEVLKAKNDMTFNKILLKKINPSRKSFIDNLCQNLENEDLFCNEFLNQSFWEKIINSNADRIYAENICQNVLKTSNPSLEIFNTCLKELKRSPDLCLYPGRNYKALRPQPNCDQLSTALNHSQLKIISDDCPGESDQLIATNVARIVKQLGFEKEKKNYTPCSASSSATTFRFNQAMDNEENWKTEACYQDYIAEKEVCYKTFFSESSEGESSFASVVAKILKKTKGMDPALNCEMISSEFYNPQLLKFKSGCYIIYDSGQCHISECKFQILLNNLPVNLISIKGRGSLNYLPLNMDEERFSQHYLMTRDFKKTSVKIDNVTNAKIFLRNNSQGIIHGIACAEDILPSFFKTTSLNQCSSLPFILSGIIESDTRKENLVSFVTITAADSLIAPRIISWSSIWSGVKSYQKKHPLKLWSMYGIY